MSAPTGMTSSLARGFCGHPDTEWQVVIHEMTILDSHAISCMSTETLGTDIGNVTLCQWSLNTWPDKLILHYTFYQLHWSDTAVTMAVRPLCVHLDVPISFACAPPKPSMCAPFNLSWKPVSLWKNNWKLSPSLKYPQEAAQHTYTHVLLQHRCVPQQWQVQR